MNLTTGNFKHALADRRDDLYETPAVAVKALLEVEKLPETIWEPACGPGSIVSVLRDAGHLVYATDLVDYGCPDSESRRDFLLEQAPSFYVGAIVTNPPFKLAGEFVAHAMALGIPKIVMLLRLAFMESERRSAILDNGWLSRVYRKGQGPRNHGSKSKGRKMASAMIAKIPMPLSRHIAATYRATAHSV